MISAKISAADQVTAAQFVRIAPAPNDDSRKPVVVGAVYFTPVIRLDPATAEAIWEIRDPSSGAVMRQYPSKRELAADHGTTSVSA